MIHRVKTKNSFAEKRNLISRQPLNVKGLLVTTVLLCLLTQAASANDETVPDIELLEFLGTIAGLEGMGVEIDELLAGSVTEEDGETGAIAVADTEASEGEYNE